MQFASRNLNISNFEGKIQIPKKKRSPNIPFKCQTVSVWSINLSAVVNLHFCPKLWISHTILNHRNVIANVCLQIVMGAFVCTILLTEAAKKNVNDFLILLFICVFFSTASLYLPIYHQSCEIHYTYSKICDNLCLFALPIHYRIEREKRKGKKSVFTTLINMSASECERLQLKRSL